MVAGILVVMAVIFSCELKSSTCFRGKCRRSNIDVVAVETWFVELFHC